LRDGTASQLAARVIARVSFLGDDALVVDR
jgi:hypothetical protein